MKSKRHLVNKNLFFVTSRNKVLSLPDTWKMSKQIKLWLITRSVGQTHSLYITVWQQTPDNLFFNPSVNSKKFGFPSNKNMPVEFFSGSDKTLKVFLKKLEFKSCWMIIFAELRSHQKPIRGCNLESSHLSNFFIEKGFYSANFPGVMKNLPTC